MIDIQDEKIKLIKHIAELSDAQILLQIQAFIKEIEEDHLVEKEDIYEWSKNQVTPDHIDLVQLAIGQHYSTSGFFEALNKVDQQLFAEQSLEELLESLTA
ncbi:hypothetical protein [Haliscomenobacter sp.]|uniref:hypothetical protein n=1 Tax=Haliscomenobacter sp. TaxID=2717303 RepID=UPI00359393FA